MNLEEYLWRTRKTYRMFAEETTSSTQGMTQYVNKRHSPSLLTAMKIYAASGGKVSLIELMSTSDMKELLGVLENLKKRNSTEVEGDLIASIESTIMQSMAGRDQSNTDSR